MKKAIYPLSADPIHKGHLYNITVAANSGLFDQVYVSIGNDPRKKYLFNIDERVFLAKKAVYSSDLDSSKLVIEPFSGFLRNYAKSKCIEFIIRGCRDSKDFDYEKKISRFNDEFGLKTFLIPSAYETENVSSTLVKTLACEGGFVNDYVHPIIKQALEERLRNISLIAVTGNMGAGKTTFCQNFVEHSKRAGSLKVNHIDFDKLVHSLYIGNSPLHCEVKEKILNTFGEGVFDEKGLNRKKLAGIGFGDQKKRKELSDILKIPSMIEFENTLRGMEGVVLVDAAYFTEYDMLPLVNYNVILVGCDEEERFARVLRRDGIDKVELESKTKAQHPQELKKRIIREAQESVGHGFFYEVDSTKRIDFEVLTKKIKEFFPLRLM